MPAVDASTDRIPLTGDFGLITTTARMGSEVMGNGTLTVAAHTWVEVSGKASSSSSFGDIPVGGIYYTPVAITPPADDNWYVLTENILGFARSWTIELARNQIDITALKDAQNTSIFGRPTAGGTIGGFLVANDSEANEAIRRFVKTYTISAAGVAALVDRNTDPLSFIGYTLKREANKAVIEAYYLPSMDLGTLNIGSEVGGLTDFNSPLGLRSGEISRYVITLP